MGIIGVGNMGTTHSKNLIAGEVPEMELVAVADRREARRDWAKENLPETVKIFEEGDQLIESGLVRRCYHCGSSLSASDFGDESL